MSVAFNGIDSLVVTFQAEDTAAAGVPAAMSGNDTVGKAAAGTAPVGIVLGKRKDYAAVQLRGYVQAAYTGTAPALGFASLVADGSGGLRAAGTGEIGRNCLVVSVDTTGKTMGLFL